MAIASDDPTSRNEDPAEISKAWRETVLCLTRSAPRFVASFPLTFETSSNRPMAFKPVQLLLLGRRRSWVLVSLDIWFASATAANSLRPVQDEGLKKLLMSWYYAGKVV
jgi:hypothetical protein